MLKHVPNIITFCRLCCAPILVVMASTGASQCSFLWVLGSAMFTDAIDGFLARKLKAQSDFGRRLDSWADYALLAALAFGLWQLWPDIVRSEMWWILTGIVAYCAVTLYVLIRWNCMPSYHTWASKCLAVALPFALLPLLSGWSDVPLRVLVVLQVLAGLEELAIAHVLKGYSGEVPSLWHAMKRRSGGV